MVGNARAHSSGAEQPVSVHNAAAVVALPLSSVKVVVTCQCQRPDQNYLLRHLLRLQHLELLLPAAELAAAAVGGDHAHLLLAVLLHTPPGACTADIRYLVLMASERLT